jgi:hypothetical protein
MLNNYDETLSALSAFVILNAPAGAERDLQRVDVMEPSDYINLEFCGEDTQCQLYLRLEGADGSYCASRVEDADGNTWRAYRLKVEVSWPSWGSGRVEVCQRRLALMTEVLRFACEIERAFPDVYHHLSQTKAERDAQAIVFAKNRAIEAIKAAVIANSKGVKVGQSKSVVVSANLDLTHVGEVVVERKDAGRIFKYSVSCEHGRRVGEVGLVYFMRLEA